MRNMFYQVTFFNQDIGSWDTSKGRRDMRGMFHICYLVFNQDIARWDDSSSIMTKLEHLTGTTMQHINGYYLMTHGTAKMFDGATAFQQGFFCESVTMVHQVRVTIRWTIIR